MTATASNCSFTIQEIQQSQREWESMLSSRIVMALWVGCNQFLNKFNRADETFTRYTIHPSVEVTTATSSIA
jgi:hypothetical protein